MANALTLRVQKADAVARVVRTTFALTLCVGKKFALTLCVRSARTQNFFPDVLVLAEFTYNAAKHKEIGMLPFEVDIGYIPRLTLDLLAPGPRTPNSRPRMEYAEWLIKIRMLRE